MKLSFLYLIKPNLSDFTTLSVALKEDFSYYKSYSGREGGADLDPEVKSKISSFSFQSRY